MLLIRFEIFEIIYFELRAASAQDNDGNKDATDVQRDLASRQGNYIYSIARLYNANPSRKKHSLTPITHPHSRIST